MFLLVLLDVKHPSGLAYGVFDTVEKAKEAAEVFWKQDMQWVYGGDDVKIVCMSGNEESCVKIIECAVNRLYETGVCGYD